MANKKDLIQAVQKDLELSGNAATHIVDTVLSQIQNLTVSDKRLGLSNFGTFEVRERAERKGRNMQTGKPMTIPATKVPKFHAANEFKDVVKKSK